MNLLNTRILVTRPAPAGVALCQQIKAAGGEALFFPTLAFAPPKEQRALASCDFDWLIFMSPQAVRAFFLTSESRAKKIHACARGWPWDAK